MNKPTTPTISQLEETKTREKVYKVCRVGTAKKGFYSALAGKFGGAKDYAILAYAVGKVTMDEDEGVNVYLDKDYALDQARKMAEKTEGRDLVVFSAKPIGDIVIPAGKSKTATCDGVILIEKYLDVPAPKPTATWQNITKDVVVGAQYGNNSGPYLVVHLSYKGRRFADLYSTASTSGTWQCISDQFKVKMTFSSALVVEHLE